jgi:hypothetical protein
MAAGQRTEDSMIAEIPVIPHKIEWQEYCRSGSYRVPKSADLDVLCLGSTIVYAPGREEAVKLFKQAFPKAFVAEPKP